MLPDAIIVRAAALKRDEGEAAGKMVFRTFDFPGAIEVDEVRAVPEGRVLTVSVRKRNAEQAVSEAAKTATA